MENAAGRQTETRDQIQNELLENVQRAKMEFRNATADNSVSARESYVRALDTLNTFLRSDKIPGDA